MIDGTGRYLPESKRGLPTPRVSFFKVFGLSRLFKRSKFFNTYHLGYLPEMETNVVDVLAGAFMMIRRRALDAAGLLDERFFMYGEDIDLSYRITRAGFRNYYFPGTTIIHYKGESTKRGSLNYVRLFYQAMILFAEKHFSTGRARTYRWAIRTAVYLKAAFAGASRLWRALWLPLVEAGVIFSGIYVIKELYARNVKDAATYYPEEYMYYIVPVYVLVWIVSIFFSGGYDRPWRISKSLRGVFIGTVLIAAIYGFLPDNLRYSRAMIILGAAWAGFAAMATRSLALMFSRKSLRFSPHRDRRLVIVGHAEEGQRVLNLLNQTASGATSIGLITPGDAAVSGQQVIGQESQLERLVEAYDIDEILFCARDVPAVRIIAHMNEMKDVVTYKIAAADSGGIIGSNSKKTAGDLYAFDTNLAISQPGNRRSKRVFDLMLCTLMLVLLPITLLVVKNRPGWLRNWAQVVVGRKSWVGYAAGANGPDTLPRLRPGVINPATPWPTATFDAAAIGRLNLLYARDYAVHDDWRLIWRSRRRLGQ
jgi:hypothetical protein